MQPTTFSKVINEWVKPSFVAGAFVALCYYQLQLDVKACKDTITELRSELYRVRAHGSDGFLDAESHGAMDQHIEHWHRELLGTKGWREFVAGHADGSPNKE